MSVGFDEEDRGDVAGDTDVGEVLDAAENFLVQELKGAGNDSGGDDGGDGFGGGVHRDEGGEERLARDGLGKELEEDLGDDAEGALAADEEGGGAEGLKVHAHAFDEGSGGRGQAVGCPPPAWSRRWMSGRSREPP